MSDNINIIYKCDICDNATFLDIKILNESYIKLNQ